MGERPRVAEGVSATGGAHRLLVSAWWVAANNGGVALVSIAALIATARLLDPYEFAAAAVAFSVVSIFTPLAEGFFNDVILQRRSLGPPDLATAWLASIGLGAAFSLLMWLAAPGLAAL